MNDSFKRRWKDSRLIRRMFDDVALLFRVSFIHTFLVYFSVFSAKRAHPALSLPKPCLSPTLALGKKYRLIGPFFGFLISFHMILFCVCLAHARQQGLGTPVATGVALSADSIKPLKIGDTIPEALWNMPLQMVKAGQEEIATVTLNDYRGKLIILDFWATSCGACIASMPKYQQLQRQFEEDLTLLPITYEAADKVRLLKEKNSLMNGISLPMVVGNRSLAAYFPHNLLPHIVWIGKDGVLWAITSGHEVNELNIKKARSEKPFDSRTKTDVLTFDETKPILLESNTGRDDNFKYRSVITGYIAGLPGLSGIREHKGAIRLFATNNNLIQLYRLAYPQLYAIPRHRYRLQIADNDFFLDPSSLTSSEREAWQNNYFFCYELIFPQKKRHRAHLAAKQDIDRFFSMESSIVTEKTRCLILRSLNKKPERSDEAITDETVFMQGVPYKELTNWLAENTGIPDVFLETSLPHNLVLELPTNMKDWNAYNPFLSSYGLNMEAEERVLPYFVLKDDND